MSETQAAYLTSQTNATPVCAGCGNAEGTVHIDDPKHGIDVHLCESCFAEVIDQTIAKVQAAIAPMGSRTGA